MVPRVGARLVAACLGYRCLAGRPEASCTVTTVRLGFVTEVFNTLVARGTLGIDESVLAVAAGRAERDLFLSLGLEGAVITNLDTVEASDRLAPYPWAHEDAQALSYTDCSFDWAVVVDGLHHCTSPHGALLEMYRVARRGVIVIEARDSWLMRMALRMNLSSEYEVEAVIHQSGRSGGLENGPVPNHVYRWTESEFRKTIRSADPTGEHGFEFHYGLNLPYETAELRGWGRKAMLLKLADPILRAATAVFKKQRNSMAMIATRPDRLWPWLTEGDDGELKFTG